MIAYILMDLIARKKEMTRGGYQFGLVFILIAMFCVFAALLIYTIKYWML